MLKPRYSIVASCPLLEAYRDRRMVQLSSPGSPRREVFRSVVTGAAIALSSITVLTSCSAQSYPGSSPSTQTSSSRGTSQPSIGRPTTSTDAPTYRVGATVTGGELAADLMDRIGERSFQVTTTSGSHRVTCVVTAAATGDFVMPKPADGIYELRVLRDMAYLKDQPGKSKPWLAVDLSSDHSTVPTQAVADALNKIGEVRAGDCRWNERLAAIEPTGVAKVTAATADGWTLSVPTDPESQGDKSSDSRRSYPLGTWRVTKEGLPASYQAADSSRATVWSKWSDQRVIAPPVGQIRR